MRIPSPIHDIERRLVARATASDESEEIFTEFCEALSAVGLPLWRASLSVPTIDPLFRGVSLAWRCGEGLSLSSTAHGPEGEDVFARSPIAWLHASEQTHARWRLDGDAYPNLPLLAELRAAGATDYLLHLTGFAPGTALSGVGISFATDRAEGFSEAEAAVLAALVPSLALVTAKLALSHTLREVVGTYLGTRTAERVLSGEMRRGQGAMVPAAILLTDLRGFTALADRHAPPHVVSWLDEHFDALGEPVTRHGGEVLKFLGDGFLAIFPVSDPEAPSCPACAGAFRAAREALARNGALNLARARTGLPELKADIVLHYGPVVYGNVGTDRRLDFTIIGSAVNEASRIEQLCAELDQPLLLSDAFAARCREGLRALGSFTFRGIERPHRVWAPSDPL
ncbi:adenylate/guanylate cyclase domain-containing protein [Methylobacterium organophilum]|uniref:Guanylate cyclase domain-containing protein n=1 Tax=Methylobacterium organophilum TaxID=410 RepID=A0ABQ4TE79_METOR|nr:adenylate/guanylate cyclase domain-containing protein [Methylobacterium organophilum]GJE29528.1 hypothetical protein LKMONMHP_4410 [Methylobacterium organophilum]